MLVSWKFEQLRGIKGLPSPKPPKPPNPPNPRWVMRAATDPGPGTSDLSSEAVAHFAPQDTGKPDSWLTPLCDGPRQCGQFAAVPTTNNTVMETVVSQLRMSLDPSRICPGSVFQVAKFEASEIVFKRLTLWLAASIVGATFRLEARDV